MIASASALKHPGWSIYSGSKYVSPSSPTHWLYEDLTDLLKDRVAYYILVPEVNRIDHRNRYALLGD